MYLCNQCDKVLPNSETYLLHIKWIHKLLEKKSCGICFRLFDNIYNLRKHLKNIHDAQKIYDYPIFDNIDKDVPSVSAISLNEISQECEIQSDCQDSIKNYQPTNNFEDSILNFPAKLYNNNTITRKTIQEVVENSSELIQDIITNIKCTATELKFIKEDAVHEFNIFLANFSINAFISEHKRFKYFENQKSLIKPLPFLIGEEFDDNQNDKDVILSIKKCEGQIINILEVLKQFLELPNILESIIYHIDSETRRSPDIISSLFNGNLWRKIKNINQDKLLLPLLVYFDDYEPGNPLGTQAGVHKIGAIYFSIGGVPPKFASLLDNIFLFGLFFSSDRVKYSNKFVLKPFIDKLTFLEKNGIKVEYEGKSVLVYFSLFLLIGDNLGIHAMTGFSESFSGEFSCRVCLCDKTMCKKLSLENTELLRNELNYNEDVRNKAHGVREWCFWNQLSNYHNIENISFDIMHDLYEGICRYDMGHILYSLIYEKKYFTLEQLNKRIKYFGHRECDIGNRIPLINDKHIAKRHIIMSSSEMSAFVAYFGFLVGDFVDPQDEYWHFYYTLIQIIHIIIKPIVNKEQLSFLGLLIKEHHEQYILLFNDNLKMKHHWLLHYPRIISEVGPLCYLSSIRYEAFHKIAKTNAHVVFNRRNIIYTLAIRHQLKLSYRLLSKKGFDDELTIGAMESHISEIEDFDISLIENNVTHESFLISWFKRNGIKFSKNMCIQINRDEFGDPVFGLIRFIIFTPPRGIIFIYNLLMTNTFNTDIYGYIVDETFESFKSIELHQIHCSYPTAPHKIAGNKKAIHSFKQDL
ncbi:unnamed protein product [Ceutorhynchus assimilis]|uniref:C2H2-type domain-containing protein n=1 Tax=Ceutorhynchus assimilis TaxID=467358 RepID=A0A9N9MZG7_9CUCU|nr:unnamed protein product [Ceutorhynchus assimilis]